MVDAVAVWQCYELVVICIKTSAIFLNILYIQNLLFDLEKIKMPEGGALLELADPGRSKLHVADK
jgi:hypothetical protein